MNHSSTRDWLRRSGLILLSVVSLFLFIDLIFLNGILLTWMRLQLSAAYFGRASLLFTLLFKRVATDAYKTPLSLYQDKLTTAYQEIKVPFLLLVIGITSYIWLSTRPAGARFAIRNGLQRLGFLAFFCLLLPICAHAFLGTYSRYIADDYCAAQAAQARGILNATVNWYVTWSGRFMADFLDSLLGYGGPQIMPFVTPIVVLVFFAALVFALYQFLPARTSLPRFFSSAILAAALLFSILKLSPTVSQSIYWAEGMHIVVPPLILGLVCTGLLRFCSTNLHTLKSRILFGILAGLIAFIAGGFCETFGALQTSALGITLLIVISYGTQENRRKIIPQTALCLLGSLASLVVIYFSPGTSVRQGQLGAPAGLIGAMRIAIISSFDFLRMELSSWERIVALLALILLAAVVTGAMGVNIPVMQIKRILLGLPLITLVLLVACFVSGGYALRNILPDRTQIIPVTCLVCSTAAWGGVLGVLVQQKNLLPRLTVPGLTWTGIAAFVLVLYLAIAPLEAYKVIRQVPVYSAYGTVWDANDAQIRAAKSAGFTEVQIKVVQNWAGLGEIGLDSTYWENRCASQYYGIKVTGVFAK